MTSAGSSSAAATSASSDQAAAAAATARDAQHAWEATDASLHWSNVQEDEEGNLLSGEAGALDAAARVRLRRKRLHRSDAARSDRRLRRDMLRYVYLVLDGSRHTRVKDTALPGGTRLEHIFRLAGEFVAEYHDQNPLGHLGIVLCKDGEAEMLSRPSGSVRRHREALVAALREESADVGPTAGGEFSLQNGLEVAGRSLGHAPRHGSREVVVLSAALSTCDPGDLLGETLPRLKAAQVRVSCVGLTAELHVCRKIADETGGWMGVCLDRNHLRDLVLGRVIPPPSRPGGHGRASSGVCDMVTMGFPTRISGDVPSLVHTSSAGGGGGSGGSERKAAFARTGYACPRCHALSSDLPIDCAVCGLRLVLAPHLARSFHHLFPVAPFAEVPEDVVLRKNEEAGRERKREKKETPGAVTSSDSGIPTVASSSSSVTYVVSSTPSSAFAPVTAEMTSERVIELDTNILASSTDCDRCCYACLRVIGCTRREDGPGVGGKKRQKKRRPKEASILRFQCPDCRNVFCADCDAYLHETLHNCPGCLCRA